MKKTSYYWFVLIILLMPNSCETSNPNSLPYRPALFGSSSSSSVTTLHVLPPAAAASNSHPLQIDALRAREYPGSDIVIERVLDPGVNYSRYYVAYLSEGLKIYALMTVPNGEKPSTGWPVIIFNHGFIPPDQYRTMERYVAYVDWLARAGYIVFRSDYRGHGDSEGEASGAYGSTGYVIDVLNATASMARYPAADPN